MTGDTLRQAEMIKKVCGAQNYSNVMLVTTRWPDDLEAQKKWGCPVREGDLRRMFWRGMVEGGSKMWRFDDTAETARAIIRTFCDKNDIFLTLQEEMTPGKLLENTSAGSYVVEQRKNDEQRLSAMFETVVEHPADPQVTEEIEDLKQSIEHRIAGEAILKEDVSDHVTADIKRATEVLKRERRKNTVMNIISWLFQVGSITANIVGAALGS